MGTASAENPRRCNEVQEVMYERLAQKLLNRALKEGIIQPEDTELYSFAYQSLLAQFFNWASAMVIAWLFGVFLPMFVYMLFFVPLRSYAGGYHESSYGRCYFSSLAMFIILMVVAPAIVILITN